MEIIRKFDSQKDLVKLKSLPFSYFSNLPFLDYSGHILLRNSELILVTQDIFYNHEFPALFLPKKSTNWREASITFTTDNDLNKLKKQKIEIIIKKPLGAEFFYKTKSLLEPAPNIRRRIEQFKKNINTRLLILGREKKLKIFIGNGKNKRSEQMKILLIPKIFSFSVWII